MEEKRICGWAKEYGEFISYHNEEWGVPVHDDRHLFEMLILEGAQAGLSWLTVLKKRKGYRKAFDNFDVEKVARYDEHKKEALRNDPGIIRNKSKINATVVNAQCFIKVQKEFGSFDKYIWSFVDGKPIINEFKIASERPASTDLSDKISKDLKKRGFKFVGSTIIYAFMQGIGMVNDHTTDCFRWKECAENV